MVLSFYDVCGFLSIFVAAGFMILCLYAVLSSILQRLAVLLLASVLPCSRVLLFCHLQLL
ncbi:hypothetical protein HMPREF3190_00694 [Umbribacter vaginalis]|nr:hypothetical protein HMPREF3190_00694 [Coriobacteriales bacterium DNF00809]